MRFIAQLEKTIIGQAFHLLFVCLFCLSYQLLLLQKWRFTCFLKGESAQWGFLQWLQNVWTFCVCQCIEKPQGLNRFCLLCPAAPERGELHISLPDSGTLHKPHNAFLKVQWNALSKQTNLQGNPVHLFMVYLQSLNLPCMLICSLQIKWNPQPIQPSKNHQILLFEFWVCRWILRRSNIIV